MTARPTRSILAPLLVGMFARALQLTVIGPSLLDIAKSLGAALAGVGWIMALYAVGSLVAQPIAGRLSDARGRKLAFVAAVACFGAGSVVCALSTTLGMLIAGRVVQSFGAGAIAPAATAIVGEYVPARKQGAALGAMYGMFALAAVIGSVVGGALIDGGRSFAAHHVLNMELRNELATYPWHLIFWINVPLAIATLGLCALLPADRREVRAVAFDGPAIAAFAGIAACLMLSALSGPSAALAWLAGALALGAGLVLWERGAAAPLIDPGLFDSPGPARVYAVAVLSGIPIYSITMYGAAYYIEQFHASAAQAGIAMLALGIPLGFGLGAGAKLINRIGARFTLVVGAVALTAGDALMAGLTEKIGVIVALALCGLAMGLLTAAPNVLIFSYVPAEQKGAASGLLTMLGATGAISAPVAVTAFLHYGPSAGAAAFRLEFAAAVALAAACVPLVATLPAGRTTA